jgi:hypothetical protein
MSLSRHDVSARAIDWVAAWADGALAQSRLDGYHVDSRTHGRLRVHARCRASESLLWFHVLHPRSGLYDAVVLVELDSGGSVVAAWKLKPDELLAAATSSTTQNGRRLLKLPVGGEWTRKVPRVAP